MNVRIWFHVVEGHVVLCWKLAPRWLGNEAGSLIVGQCWSGDRYLVGSNMVIIR